MRLFRAANRPGPPWAFQVFVGAVTGFLVNLLPVEIFPGIHLVFGGAFALLAGVRFGPLAGGIVGFVAALPTWWLWNQPLPLSACLLGLEGVAVGIAARNGRRSLVAVDLTYWLLLGSWLNLAVQLWIIGLPFQVAFIVQCRSVLNGLLVAMVVELGLVIHGISRPRSADAASSLQRPDSKRVVTLVLTALISLPLLGITLRNAHTQVEDRLHDLERSASREVEALRGEVTALLRAYEGGVATAATIIQEHGLMAPSFLQDLLDIVHRNYPEFQGLYVADAEAKTLAFEPPRNPRGESLVGLDYSDREYFRALKETHRLVFSGVYQARGGMTGPAVALGAPILSEPDGEFLGFVLGWFDVRRSFESLVRGVEHEGMAVIVTDGEGRVIARSDDDPESAARITDLSESPELALQHGRASGTFRLDEQGLLDGSPALAVARDGALIAFAEEPTSGWRIWIRQSLAPIRGAMLRTATLHLLVLMACLLAALGLSSGLARLLTAPFERLRRSAEALAAGNLSERPGEPRLATAEIDSLFGSFAAMARNLERSWDGRRRLLAQVTQTQRELAALFEAMTDAVVLTDTEDRILRANRAFRTIQGPDPGVIGRPLREVAHPDGDWESCRSCAARLAGRSDTIFLGPEENTTGRPIEVRIDIIRDSDGQTVGAVQVIRDLSELRRWETAAERAESVLRHVVETAYDAIFAADLEGRLLWANQCTLEIFELTESAVRGYSLSELFHQAARSEVKGLLERAAAGRADPRELRLVAGEGSRRVLLTLSPIHEGDEVTALLGIARDVTEERLAAERMRRDDKLRALGQLAAGVAHNFNNALTSVLGYAQLAGAASDDAEVRGPLRVVETAARDAAQTVRRIQRFARAGEEEPLQPVSLVDLGRDALELTRSRWAADAQAAGIVYEVRPPNPTCDGGPCEEALVEGDPSALRETLVNLIINALDAMPGGGLLTLSARCSNESVAVAVEDTGCGMGLEVRERLFDPFFTTKGPSGQGLGMAISYSTVRRHGGEILVESEPGRGSRIEIVLPRRRAGDGDGASTDLAPEALRDGENLGSVLVVEDESPIRDLLVEILARQGFDVSTAADGTQGLERLRERRFDLVITDLAMPGADGMAVAREARLLDPEVKLMVMTGYGANPSNGGLPADPEVPIDAWLAKPFDAAVLLEAVAGLMSSPTPGYAGSPSAARSASSRSS